MNDLEALERALREETFRRRAESLRQEREEQKFWRSFEDADKLA